VDNLGETGVKLRNIGWWYLPAFAAAFVFSIVAATPAQWAGAALEHATHGRVRVLAATGSAWHGRGDLAIRMNGGEIVLRGASWDWLPERLLAGEFAIAVSTGRTGGRLVIARGFTYTVVRDLDPLRSPGDAV
jgi:hypothetical protein